MCRSFRGLLALLATFGCCMHAAAAPVILISIDGLHPGYVLEAERHRLQVPHLRSFVSDGAYATGVKAVVPTVTYPNHTTMVTGASPAEHGIVSNTTFDPLGVNHEGWYWYAEDIRVDTLWKRAAQAQIVTASVNWPVTVGDPHIRFLLPEFWRTSTPDDLKLMRALTRPEGLMQRMEAKLGPFVDGYTDTVESDRIRTRFATALLREQKPGLMAIHLIALDGIQHQLGPWVPDVFRTLEAIDGMIGDIAQAALSNDPATTIAIVSDHGFIATHTAVNLRTAFAEAGFIRLKKPLAAHAAPIIEAWDAQVWSGAAVGAVVLRNPEDAATRKRVAALLDRLKADPANGIARVLDATEMKDMRAFPGTEFLIEFAPGFYLGTAVSGPLLTTATSKGTHGYLPDCSEMYASFFIKGRAIAKGRNLGVIDMRRVAPTLARSLGVALSQAREPALAIGDTE